MKNLKLNDLNVQELNKEEMCEITGGDNFLKPITNEINGVLSQLVSFSMKPISILDNITSFLP